MKLVNSLYAVWGYVGLEMQLICSILCDAIDESV